jgi:L-asparaginase/Glu-tRNA(Gln) amidotransferase subunit D
MASVIPIGAWFRLVVLLQKEHAVIVLAASMRLASAVSADGLMPGSRCAKAAEIWRR